MQELLSKGKMVADVAWWQPQGLWTYKSQLPSGKCTETVALCPCDKTLWGKCVDQGSPSRCESLCMNIYQHTPDFMGPWLNLSFLLYLSGL